MPFFKSGLVKKITSVFLAFAVVGGMAVSGDCGLRTLADTQSELEARQEELAAERKNVEAKLKEAEGKADEMDQYLEDYNRKMKLQEEQISVLDEQIDLCSQEISDLSAQVEQKQLEVDEGIEKFRKRIRALYIAGNDSYASVLVGASDFYDILARIELMQRVSRHDNDLIDELKVKIETLDGNKAELAEKQASLEEKKLDEEKYYEELRQTYNDSAEVKAMREAEAADYAARKDEIEDEQEKIEQQLQEEIRRKQEEAEKRRKEEEERRRKEEEEKKKQAEQNGETYVEKDVQTFTSYSDTGFIWPCPDVRNTSDGYGWRYIQENGKNEFHKGVDITKPGCAGMEIVASAAGEVITAGDTGNGYGYHVVIDHGNGIATLYGHCSSLAVKVGDIVTQGQVIGYIGHSGYAYGNHCHFEVRVNGQHTDPMNYVSINN